jgi:hypothetical protein
MKLDIICMLLVFLLSSCAGMSAFAITTTTTPTVTTSTPSPTRHLTKYPTVQITGDVYVRDDAGKIVGWLYRDDQVQATCSDDWCQILSGSYSGYDFWRGCSSDNPENRSCQAR